ncbi:MAG TPA: molybdopterin-dependent oxidoreductase [Gaiellaceae bacterium]|jgi:DMSO/TMAO reductase YedYZ molybdopterin-dependent catalytic subunit
MSDHAARRYGRATFLALLGGGLSSIAWAPQVSGFVSPVTSSFSQLLGNLFPVGGWRIYTISGSMPVFDTKAWRLDIGGLVGKPRSFTYDEVLALPQSHQVSDFHCVTGWTVRNVRWTGVRFKDVLDLVEPMPEAKAIEFTSLEIPYTDSLTLEQVRLHDVMLAVGMDGAPLSRPHGSPMRVVIPEMYGYKGVKWLTSMKLVSHEPTGYWEGLGYDQNAWVGHSNGYGSGL